MVSIKKFFFKKTLRGFSFGEVLLGSFILTVGLTAMTALIASGYRHSIESRDTIIAAELAQEGVELIRNARDNDFASGGGGFAAFSNPNKHCRIDYNDSIASLDCNAAQGGVNRYYLQYAGGLYGHFGGGQERFSRYIYVDYNGSDQALVRSFVFWSSASLPPSSGSSAGCSIANKCVFTEARLANWK